MQLFKRNKEDLIGNIYDVNGNIYSLYESQEKLNKKYEALYEKMNISPKRNVVLRQGDSLVEQEYAVKIKFDFRESTRKVNIAFLSEFLVFPHLVQQLVERSILTMDMINYIWENDFLKTEFIKNAILAYQDVFDEDFIRTLKYNQLWIVITHNTHRSIEKLKPYRRVVEVFLEIFFTEYLLQKFLRNEGTYEEWKKLLHDTIKNYLPDLDKELIREKSVSFINEKIKNIELSIFDLDLQRKSIEYYYDHMNDMEKSRKDIILKSVSDKKIELLELVNTYKSYIDVIDDFLE